MFIYGVTDSKQCLTTQVRVLLAISTLPGKLPSLFLLILTQGDVFIDFYKEGGAERRGEHRWERNINRLPLVHAQTRDGTHSLSRCPDWELNLQAFGVRDARPGFSPGASAGPTIHP